MARNFDTKFSRVSNTKNFCTECGNGFIDDFAYKIVDNTKTLVKIGKHDVQAEIESFKDSCDINMIVARFVAGDDSALNQVQGFYADMKSMPKTYAEWHEKYTECENFFNRLPVDIREQFNHSVSEFWSDFGSEHFFNVFSEQIKEDVKVKEVVEDAK